MVMPLPARLLSLAICVIGAFALLAPRPALADNFTDAQKKEIQAIIQDYLSNHPDLLLQAIEKADDKLKSDAKDKATKALAEHRQEVLADPASPVAGNPNGNVTLVEFFDYRCPYCKEVEPSLEKLVSEDHQLRFIYKEFPVLGPDSEIAAHVALAARKQGKYDAFHHAMMALTGHIDEAAIYKVAASVGLDIDRLKQDAKSPDVEKELAANIDLGNTLGIDGTPGFIVGDQIVDGAMPLSDLKQLIATARGQK
jgi:protein-disulfide isomerase